MQTFFTALEKERPLLVPGVLNPFVAMQAKNADFKAVYLSGAALSNFHYGVPDVGIIGLEEVVHMTKAITRVCDLPLLVDIDTGFDDPSQTVRELIAAGASAIHIEDQTEDKRCGHLDGKRVVGCDEMCERIRKAVEGRGENKDFMIMARTDAYALEGLDVAIARMKAYIAAGADAIFAEALTDLNQYDVIRKEIGPKVPLLANITEFGKTKLYCADELKRHGVDMMLMPVSVARAQHGHTASWLGEMRQRGCTEFLVEKGHLRPRTEYNKVLGYDPASDNQKTVLAKLANNKTNKG